MLLPELPPRCSESLLINHRDLPKWKEPGNQRGHHQGESKSADETSTHSKVCLGEAGIQTESNRHSSSHCSSKQNYICPKLRSRNTANTNVK